jgi:hypothetical protein
VIVALTRSAIALVVAIVVGGCSGGQERDQVFTAADATRIANVRPVTPGWTWPQNPEKPVSSDSRTKAQSTDSLLVELKRQTADLVDLGDAGDKWRDNDKLANLSVGVFASASDAHKEMAPFNAFSRGWGERTGRVTKDEEIEGLGDEAWLLRTEANGTQVTYHWRRGNLVVEAAHSLLRVLPKQCRCCNTCVGRCDRREGARSFIGATRLGEVRRSGTRGRAPGGQAREPARVPRA